MKDDIMNRLAVWSDHCLAGVLTINRSGAMAFTYDPEWIEESARAPLSHSMPKRAEPYDDASCKVVFGGLLPEEDQRAAVARALGVSRENVFFAMRFGRASTLEQFDEDAQARFASDIGMTRTFVNRRIADLAKGVAASADGVIVPGLDDAARLHDLPAIIKDRAERLALKVGAEKTGS